MDRESLKKKFLRQYDEFVLNHKDIKSEIDKLLAMKGQISTEPMEVFVPSSDVTTKIDWEFAEISLAKEKILVRFKGGLSIVATMENRVLYRHLYGILDLWGIKDKLDDDTIINLKKVIDSTLFILLSTTYCFTNDKLFSMMYKSCIDIQLQMQKDAPSLIPSEETIEDLEKNEEFKNDLRLSEKK